MRGIMGITVGGFQRFERKRDGYLDLISSPVTH